MDSISRLIDGSVDMHVHTAPSLFPRRVDEVDVARQAEEARMRAVVAKSHHHSTAPELMPLRKHVFADMSVEVFGSVALNSYVGGLNPYVVDLTLRMGGRVIWFPTISATNHIRHHEAKPDLKFPTQERKPLPEVAVPVLDETGELLPAARQILGQIAEANAVMSPGHVSPEEALALVRGGREAGVKNMIVNHPEFVMEASEAQIREFVRLGAYIEHSICQFHPEAMFYEWPVEHLVRWIDLVGPDVTVLGTDTGQKNNPLPVDVLRWGVEQLLERGFKESDVEKMIKSNPARLLGLDG